MHSPSRASGEKFLLGTFLICDLQGLKDSDKGLFQGVEGACPHGFNSRVVDPRPDGVVQP